MNSGEQFVQRNIDDLVDMLPVKRVKDNHVIQVGTFPYKFIFLQAVSHKAFLAIEEKGGVVNASELAGGISEAMVTTASGLVVGIIAYLAYNTLVAMVNKVMYKLELTSTSFIDILQEPAG